MKNITDNTNKELLWNLLYENNIFKNIPNNKQPIVKDIFETTLNQYRNYSVNNDNDIVNINKKIISDLINKINNFKHTLLTTIFDKDDFKNNKSRNINNKLELHKESMENMLNPNKPSEIDFKDDLNEDKPLNSNEMNEMLIQMQKDRQVDNKIIGKNIILSNNIETTMNINNNSDDNKNINVSKLKINNIEELLGNPINIIELDKNNNENIKKSNNEENEENEDKLSINNTTNFLKRNMLHRNSFIANEYLSENKVNTNIKLDTIIQLLKQIKTTNDEIIDRLNKSENNK